MKNSYRATTAPGKVQLVNQTTAPVSGTEPLGVQPEFVRVGDIQRLTGVKRGITYRLIASGKFRSVLLRERGSKTGIRLVYWPSVREFLHRLLAEQNPPGGPPVGNDSEPSVVTSNGGPR